MNNKCLSSECPCSRLQNFSAHSLCCLHWGPGTQDSGASLPTPPRRSLQLGRHGGWWDSAVSNVRPWRVGVPGRGAETRGGTRQKWTWSSTQGEGIEAEVRVWTHFSENKAIGWSEGWAHTVPDDLFLLSIGGHPPHHQPHKSIHTPVCTPAPVCTDRHVQRH